MRGSLCGDVDRAFQLDTRRRSSPMDRGADRSRGCGAPSLWPTRSATHSGAVAGAARKTRSRCSSQIVRVKPSNTVGAPKCRLCSSRQTAAAMLASVRPDVLQEAVHGVRRSEGRGKTSVAVPFGGLAAARGTAASHSVSVGRLLLPRLVSQRRPPHPHEWLRLRIELELILGEHLQLARSRADRPATGRAGAAARASRCARTFS